MFLNDIIFVNVIDHLWHVNILILLLFFILAEKPI